MIPHHPKTPIRHHGKKNSMRRTSFGRAAAVILVASATLAGCSTAASDSDAADESAAPTDAAFDTITPGVVRVASQPDNKPYSYIEGSEDVGLDTELVKLISKNLGLETEIVHMDFAAMIPSVVNGSVDIAASSVSNTEERREIVDFSDPTLFGPVAVLTSKGSGVTDDTDTLDGKRLAVNQGTIQDQYAQDNWKADIVRFPDNNSGVAALKLGSVDAVFMDAPLAQASADEDDTLEVALLISDIDDPYGIVFNKDDAELRDAFDEQLAALIADGTLEELQTKYLPDLPINDMFKPAS
jgi:polar amino acid transport system substrate-binding protein